MAEIAVSVASRVSEYVVLPITRPVHYLCYYKSNLENLKKEVGKLDAGRERLQYSIEDARRNGEEITRQVEYWLITAEEFIHEASVFIEENELLSNRCCKGWCPNLKKHYRFSRKAERMLYAVIDLLAEGTFDKVSYRTIQEKPWLQSKNNYMDFESRMSTLDNILYTLRSTDVDIIGVYGIAGIGKTSLVKQVALRAMADKLFDVVIFAEVSETPDIKMIQGVIADNLGLNFHEESLPGRTARLYERLKKEKNFLLILDNIWEILDLESIGIPCGDRCKILLTARSEEVLCEMDSKMNFSVDILNEEEALILFKKVAGDFGEQHDLRSMAIDIARECGGVPIAIVTIARGLRNKGVDEWTNVIRDLKTARIQYTYDSLKSEELETTFLLLSMMGHTYDASIGDLLRCGMSLDLFQNTDTMEEAKTYAAKLIQKLKDYALLLGTSNSERFSMDNLVREVARSIALKDRHMFNVTDDFILSDWEDKYRLKNGIAVSLLDIRQLPKKLEFPRLRFFYMKPSDPFLEIPEFFFAGMPELRVLHLIEMDLLPLPTSLRFLLNLQTLCLDQCKLGDVVVIGELEKLEILSFRSSDIEMLPKEIGRLTRLRLLDLSHCSKLKVISPNVFSNLTRLEELYMGNTSIQWEDERKLLHLSHSSKLKVIPPDAIPTLTQPEELRMGNTSIQWEVERRNTSLYELMLLHHLTTLELHVREAGLMPEDLFFKKLERYKIVIGDCNWYEKYETARTLKLKLNTSIHFKEGFLMRLKGIENLCLDEMPGIRNVLSELDRNGFPELKHLEVQNNSYFLNIVESMQSVSCDVFPLLESLFISNLINLEKICDGPLKIMDFHRLRILEVQKCDKLKNILSFSTAESLLQLQEIKVTYCKNMEEIFAIVSKEGGNNEMIDKIQVNPLRSMTLEYLPKLTSFCSRAKTPSLLQRRPSLLQRRQKAADARAKGIILEEEIDIPTLLFNENVVFPNLEALRLSAINVEKIWHNQFQAMCSWAPKLTRLIIQGCGNLRHLFSSSVVNSFVQLQYLEICECTVLEEIIVVDGLREEERVDLIFPKLIYLKINDLGSLRRFCSGNSISIEFPSLKELEIENCPELESSIFSNKVELPRLEKMIISRMDNLKTIWPNKLAYDSLWKLKSLEVNDCQKLSTVFPSFICERIFTLESLTVKSCGLVEEIFDIQGLNFEGKKSLLRELNIGYLPNLKHIWNKDPQGMLSFEKLQKVTVFLCQNLKNLFPESIARGLFGLESLEVSDSGVEEIVSKGGVVEASTGFFFPQLSSLQLHCLPELRTFYPGIYTIEGPFLKSLGLHYCDSVKVLTSDLSCYITKEGQFDIPTELPLFLIEKGFVIFEELELSGKAITMITWQDKVPESFFGFLHSLVLNDDKSTVLAFDIIQRFHNLKKLSLNHGSYKEIFSYVDAEEHVRRLPQIKHLVLNGLNELKEIWKQDSEAHLEFRNLEILEVRSCYSLSNLMPSSASFQNLKSLEVWGCEGLMNLVTSAIAKNLVQLEKLEIFDCKRLTEVVAEEGAVIEEIIFSKLKSLSLMYLQNLTSFSSRNHTFKFPILKSLVVNECPKLKIFSEGVIITPRLRKLEFNWKAIDRCWEVDLNTTIKQ